MAELLPKPPPALGIAVSGGADSMALALLARDWAAAQDVALTAFTVDHRLRPESAAEAAQVATWMQALGIPHHILVWEQDAPPQANRQALAREARYHLLAAACHARGIAHLLLAHHLDDQAETFLIRLQRGSGVDGLAAMRPRSMRHGLTLLRPLLDMPKARLQAVLDARRQRHLDDPSNRDPHYARTRIRQLMVDAGLDAASFAATAKRMARARDYLEQQTQEAIRRCAVTHAAGFFTLDYPLFRDLHEEIGLRVLAELLGRMNGSTYRPRFHELKALYDALPAPRTLAGCQLMPRGQVIILQRELAALPPAQPVEGATQGLWDARFRFRTSPACPQAEIRPLGAEGWKAVTRDQPALAKRKPLPAGILHGLPALWHLETPALIPHIGYRRQDASADWLVLERFDAAMDC